MRGPFNMLEYINRILSRWRRILVVVAAAALVAFLLSLFLPKKYDATVTLVIQPASGGGMFPATASPVYLEYLRTYEQVVQADALLSRLIRELRLDQPPYGYTVESFRASVLKVTLVRHTKLLMIRARFADPEKAHAIARTLAKMAAQANSELNLSESARYSQQVQQELADAGTRLASAQAALEKFRREYRTEEVSRSVMELLERKASQEGELSTLQVTLADKEAQLASLRSGADTGRSQAVSSLAAEIEGIRARKTALASALAQTTAALQRTQSHLATVDVRRQELENNMELAQRSVATFTSRSNDARGAVVARTEELLISDPGVVPSRPSWPRPLLNVLAAMFLGLLGSLVYETWIWQRDEQRAVSALVASAHSGGSRLPVP